MSTDVDLGHHRAAALLPGHAYHMASPLNPGTDVVVCQDCRLLLYPSYYGACTYGPAQGPPAPPCRPHAPSCHLGPAARGRARDVSTAPNWPAPAPRGPPTSAIAGADTASPSASDGGVARTPAP